MISEARTYIQTQIRKCNPDYVEIVDVFNDDNMALSQIKTGYKVSFGTLTSEYNGNYFTDIVDVSLEIYKAAKQGQELSDFDSIFDTAIGIKNTITDPLFAKESNDFSDIIWGSIIPEPLPSNDRVFKILLTFQIRKDLAFQGV